MGRGFKKSNSLRGGGGRRASVGNGFGGRGSHNKYGDGQQKRSRSLEPPPSRNRRRGGVNFTPRPAPPLPETLSSLPKFVKAKKFRGAQVGYFFCRGKAGLGYYIDRVQIGEMGAKTKARLVASVGAPPAAAHDAAGAAGPAGGVKAAVFKKPSHDSVYTGTEVPASRPATGKEAKMVESAATSAVVASSRKLDDFSDGGGLVVDSELEGRAERVSGMPGLKKVNAASVVEEKDGETGNADNGGGRDQGEANGNATSDEGGEEEGSEASDSDDHGSVEEGEEGDGTEEEVDEEEGEKDGDEEGHANGGEKDKESVAETLNRTNKRKKGEPEAAHEDGNGEDGESDSDEGGSSSGEENGDAGAGGKPTRTINGASAWGKNKQQGQVAGDTGEKAAEQEGVEGQIEHDDVKVTFQSLGVTGPLCKAATQLGWTHATEIQRQALPLAFQGKDVIGLAETGSGKTGAFAIPILQALLENPQRLFAVILAPTRELAFQINEVMEALGVGIGLKSVCIVGGIDMFQQSVALAKKPHVVIATPGRLVDHLENTKGFSLRTAKFLVLDEADRMLSMDFEEEIGKVLSVLPRERRTFLFSATMTSKVAKLQRASLKDPVRVEVTHKFATPKTLVQQYLFIPAKHKDCYLAYVLNEFAGQSTIVFVSTCNNAQRVALLLRNLGFQAVCLHGQMGQPKRLGALGKFKSGQRNVLIATDVASRGLDIPSVDLVVNMEIPSHGKDYIHRVGRTARAGRAGRSIAFVTQYDVEVYQRMEALIGQKLPPYTCDEETVLVLQERVGEAQRMAAREMREADLNKKGKGRRGGDAEGGQEGSDAVVRSFKRQRMGGGRSGWGRGGGARGGRGGRRR